MQKANYILTWRGGEDIARRDNLHAVLAWLAQYPQFEPILVEQDDAPRLDGALPHPNCTYFFAYNPGPFNKSWGLNLGFRASRQHWLAFGDADLVLGDALPQTLEELARGFQTVKPYRRLLDLDAVESARVRSGDFNWVPSREHGATANREGIGEHIAYAGGAFLITRAAFVHVGGWDERFRGWGGEDDAMSYKIERARLSGIELDRSPALHLHHARTQSTTFGQPHYANNCALLESYRELDDRQFARFAEVQMQLIGHREKYRPQ